MLERQDRSRNVHLLRIIAIRTNYSTTTEYGGIWRARPRPTPVGLSLRCRSFARLANLVQAATAGDHDARRRFELTDEFEPDLTVLQEMKLLAAQPAMIKPTEEFLRYLSPVRGFGRTVLEDVEVRGRRISTGQRVFNFFMSGNRDEEIFAEYRLGSPKKPGLWLAQTS